MWPKPLVPLEMFSNRVYFACPDYSGFAFIGYGLLSNNVSCLSTEMNVVILYKPWTKAVLKIKKVDWFIWSVPWTLKRNVSNWIDGLWLGLCRECIHKREIICGIVIAKVAFCITNAPTKLNVVDYDNTQIKYIIFQSTLSYLLKYTIHPKKINR